MAAYGDSPGLGRNAGKFETDSNGLARYSLSVEVPSGIGQGNEPNLSFEYAQGAPNGILGVGWCLGGLSSISRGTVSPPRDGINAYPRNGARLLLDGRELLEANGEYWASQTIYKTEIDSDGGTVVEGEGGYILTDKFGHVFKYGTSQDSRVVSPTGLTIEWNLKCKLDIHGNEVTYNYIPTPVSQPLGNGTNLYNFNVSYLDSIVYTSNSKTGYQGRRKVLFEYITRDDPIVYIIFGIKAVRASALSAVHIALQTGSTIEILRTYNLRYSPSQASGRSLLASISETCNGRTKLRIDATTFAYTLRSEKSSADGPFEATSIKRLTNTTNNHALLPLNASGRTRSDLAVIRVNPASGAMSVKTYLMNALSGPVSIPSWSESDGSGCNQPLPPFRGDIRSQTPTLLPADFNGDGRTDLIVPQKDANNLLQLSISLSCGTGFSNYKDVQTNRRWIDDAQFLCADLLGSNSVDVLQIFGQGGYLCFAVFSSNLKTGDISLTDEGTIVTTRKYDESIDWLTVGMQRSTSKILARVWSESLGRGNRQLKITTYRVERDPKSLKLLMNELQTTDCLIYSDTQKPYAIACDVNGDGVEDIAICTTQQTFKGAKTSLQFSFSTFLNDCSGGFIKHCDAQVLPYDLDSSQIPTGDGRFYVTRVNGTDYPDLAYVYRERSSHSIAALISRGSCSGLVNSIEYYKIADGSALPSSLGDPRITPIDFLGTGMDGFLCYTLENDVFTLYPVVNNAHEADRLKEIRDPMGLLTSILYLPISNESLYNSGIKWNDYTPQINSDAYGIISAPTHVVSVISKTNIQDVNNLPYNCTLEKTYGRAQYNARGRGWQGFAEIHTYDVSSDVTTSEYFAQEWPLTTQRIGVEVAKSRGTERQVLSSQIFEIGSVTSKHGIWDIYRLERRSDTMSFQENGKVARNYGENYEYDSNGNLVMESSWEISGLRMWTHYAWATAGNTKTLPRAKKVSMNESNIDLEKFEEGDLSLTHATYDDSTACLQSLSEWSTNCNAFATTTFSFNDYGNEVATVDPAGLRQETKYDEDFHTYAVKVSKVASSINRIQYSAYDPRSGKVVAQTNKDSSMICTTYDGFGRTSAIYMNAVKGEASADLVAASKYVDIEHSLMHPDFKSILTLTQLCPSRDMTLQSLNTENDSHFISATTKKYYNAGKSGFVEIRDLVDCVGKVRRSSTRRANSKVECNQVDFDSRGNCIRQSFPVLLPDGADQDLKWTPSPDSGTISTYDALNRLVGETKPSPSGMGQIKSTIEYLDGGSTIKKSLNTIVNGLTGTTSTTTSCVGRFDGEDKLTSFTNENDEHTTYSYDPLGRVVSMSDASSQTETRAFDTTGNITRTNDPYRNTITREYDISNNLIMEVNALGQSTTHVHDAVGRVTRTTGHSGMAIEYKYDIIGKLEAPIEINTYASGNQDKPEISRRYEYDERGRKIVEVLELADGSAYTSRFAYDWQGQLLHQTLPDGSEATYAWEGDRTSSIKVAQTTVSPSWSVNSRINGYDAFGRPGTITVGAQGALQSVNFVHSTTFDTQGFPKTHTLLAGEENALLQEQYFFNDYGQLAKSHEVLNNSTAEYTYKCSRLVSSQRDEIQRNYEYDKAGNLRIKNGTLSYAGNDITGELTNGTKLQATFNVAGQMIHRSVGDSAHVFSYDDFGKINAINDTSKSTTTQLISDHSGNTLCKVLADGSREIKLGSELDIALRADGSRSLRRRIFGPSGLLALIRTDEEPKYSQASGNWKHTLGVYFSDTKGNVTHIFDNSGKLREKREYDDWGYSTTSSKSDDIDLSATYECRSEDEATGLYDFGARWYDPLFGRFTTADDVLDEGSLGKTDGMNRFCFENNDPINHTDPTGHWSWYSIAALVVGIALAIAAIVVTAGFGGVVAGTIAGAMLGAGIASAAYAVQHQDEEGGKFFEGWAVSVSVGALIGAFTGGASAAISSAETAAASGAANWLTTAANFVARFGGQRFVQSLITVGGKILLGAFEGVALKTTANGIDRVIYGRQETKWTDGLWQAAVTGAVVAGVFGGGARTYSAFKKAPVTAYEKLLEEETSKGLRPLLAFGKAAGRGVGPVGLYVYHTLTRKDVQPDSTSVTRTDSIL